MVQEYNINGLLEEGEFLKNAKGGFVAYILRGIIKISQGFRITFVRFLGDIFVRGTSSISNNYSVQQGINSTVIFFT